MGPIGQTSTFSEHGHVAYQIKENRECSNVIATILPADTPDHGCRQYVKIQLSEHGHVAYQIKGTHQMQQYASKYFPPDPSPSPGPAVGVKRSKLNFSEHVHVEYQTKENHECSNMVSPPDPRGQKVKIQLFQNMARLHIKLNAITKCSNMVTNILPATLPPPLDPSVGVKRSKLNIIKTRSCCISN